ncbi:MAG: hypothetical protein JO329_02890, partial [Planctomycetaceae bacterium]|nr:hypothetical protein [Planctomycetaceae bacterium]
VIVSCPPVVMPSSQGVVASPQPPPCTTLPAADVCDRKHPLFGGSTRR